MVDDGWDLASIAPLDKSSADFSLFGHFYFFDDLVDMQPFTATLNWFRHVSFDGTTFSPAALVNLDLILYPWDGSSLGASVARSESTVDNLEHLWIPMLAGGDYFLRVVGRDDFAMRPFETYALSWEITSSAATIPEPSSFTLVVLGCVFMIGLKRGSRKGR
jgi:hypothetical protein